LIAENTKSLFLLAFGKLHLRPLSEELFHLLTVIQSILTICQYYNRNSILRLQQGFWDYHNGIMIYFSIIFIEKKNKKELEGKWGCSGSG